MPSASSILLKEEEEGGSEKRGPQFIKVLYHRREGGGGGGGKGEKIKWPFLLQRRRSDVQRGEIKVWSFLFLAVSLEKRKEERSYRTTGGGGGGRMQKHDARLCSPSSVFGTRKHRYVPPPSLPPPPPFATTPDLCRTNGDALCRKRVDVLRILSVLFFSGERADVLLLKISNFQRKDTHRKIREKRSSPSAHRRIIHD